jgi:hypothetical protein
MVFSLLPSPFRLRKSSQAVLDLNFAEVVVGMPQDIEHLVEQALTSEPLLRRREVLCIIMLRDPSVQMAPQLAKVVGQVRSTRRISEVGFPTEMAVRPQEPLVPTPAPFHAVRVESPEDVIDLPDRRPASVDLESPLIIWTELDSLLHSVHKNIKLSQE